MKSLQTLFTLGLGELVMKGINVFLKSLSPEKRHELKELHRIRTPYNFLPLVHISIWYVTACIMHVMPYWPIRILGYIIIGLIIHGFGALMHEASHSNITRNRKIDRWISFFCGIVVFLISALLFKFNHLDHHKYLRTDDDPDEFTGVTKNPLLLRLLYLFWIIFGAPTAVFVHFPYSGWRLASSKDRKMILAEISIALVTYSIIVTVAYQTQSFASLLHYWVLPWIVAAIFTNIRGWAEHGFTIQGNAITESRTTTSSKIVSFLSFNANYHNEHHCFPAVPWYNLPKVHKLLKSDFEKAGAFIHSSYLVFLAQAVLKVIVNPNGIVRQPNKWRLLQYVPTLILLLLPLNQVAAQESEQADSLITRAESLYLDFDNLAALAIYEEAYKLDKSKTMYEGLVMASYGYGTDLLADKKRSQAEYFFRKSAYYAQELYQRYPNQASTYFLLAVTRGYVALFEKPATKIKIGLEVEEYCKMALKLDPNYPYTYITYSILQRAVAELNWLERGIAKMLVGKYPKGTHQDALNLLLTAIEISPQSSRAHFELGVTYSRLGDDKKASFHFTKAISLPAQTTEDLRNQQTAITLLDALNS